MYILSREQTKKVENIAQNSGFSELRMMENAGSAASKIISEKQTVSGKSILILVGKGNNGGDGLVVARKLYDSGAAVSVLLTHGMPSTDASKEMMSKLSHYPVRIFGGLDSEVLTLIKKADIIVDAVFGIGFRGELDNAAYELISLVNNSNAVKVALDIPSGCECDTGKVSRDCFNADYTVAFISVKPCHVLYPASDFCGKLIRVGIGLPTQIIDSVSSNITIIDNDFVKSHIPKRKKNAHKGSAGNLAMLCGSYGMSGAAYLSGLAAVRSGVGIARMIVPDSIYPILASGLPEAVYVPYDSEDISSSLKKIADTIGKSSCAVIGCGLGTEQLVSNMVCSLISSAKIPIVLDADGINIISQNIDILMKSEAQIVLTPHPAEMARLMGATVQEIQSNRFRAAMIFAQKTGKIVVLKGANTIVALPEGKIYVCMHGNPGMATAGSGDVLAGIIGALVAQGLSPADAAVCGVHIHAASGDFASAKYSVHSMIARDIIECLPSLFKEYED